MYVYFSYMKTFSRILRNSQLQTQHTELVTITPNYIAPLETKLQCIIDHFPLRTILYTKRDQAGYLCKKSGLIGLIR